MSEKTKEEILASYSLRPLGLFNHYPDSEVLTPADALKAMQAYADQEKRSTAIAFLNAVTEDGCSNYFRVGDEWFLGDPEEEEDAEGPFTTEQVYDLYLQSLPKTV